MPDREHMVIRQQVLADFGEFALRSEKLDEVLTEACRLICSALGTDLAKVFELQEEGRWAFLRAGIGWPSGIVGNVRLALGARSSETFSLREGRPVITPDINREERFDFPEFMKKAGVAAIVNVPIFLPGGKAYGLLQVDARKPRDFGDEDIQFLRTYGAILGPVIDRLFKVQDLQVALDANRQLMQELQHRIKNHIGIITSVVRMRAKEVVSDESRQALAAVGERIEALRLVHELLYAANAVERLRLRPYVMQLIENLCHMHENQSGKVRLIIEVEELDLSADMAVPLGLILNEFVTNSLKYAFDSKGGVISIEVTALENGAFRVLIGDNGKGLPIEAPTAKPGSRTGMKLIESFARQIQAKSSWSKPGEKGTTFCQSSRCAN